MTFKYKTTYVQHGESKTAEYRIWQGIKQRCLNPHNLAYDYYGGRGVTVCDEWHEYATFLRDMGRRPSPDHSIDRIDVNGSYSPDNCRWATRLEQQRNTRIAIHIDVNGERLAIGEAACRSGMTRGGLRSRIDRGLTPDQAMTLPAHHRDVSPQLQRKSKYIGVTYDNSRATWKAFTKVNGTNKNLGRYNTEYDAALARDQFVYGLWGNDASLNFPIETLCEATTPSKATKPRRCAGADNPAAKLTEWDIRAIRQEYETLQTPYTTMAQRYQVSSTLIAQIVKRRVWKHVDGFSHAAANARADEQEHVNA